jgi:branched-chain amino acid transport system ATP-binding protein
MTKRELLRLDKVMKNFGSLRAVDEVSLSIHGGHFAGLIRPNGSGKTALFNVISSFYKPDRGGIYFEDSGATIILVEENAGKALQVADQAAVLLVERKFLKEEGRDAEE